MNSHHNENHWNVVAVENDRIVLEGGDARATIAQLQGYGEKAILKIVDQRHFLFVPTEKNEEVYISDLTVQADGGRLVITHGTQPHNNEETRDVRAAFVHRTDDEILQKRAEFYCLVTKAYSL